MVIGVFSDFGSLKTSVEAMAGRLTTLERSFKEKLTTISSAAHDISLEGWSDDISSALSTDLTNFTDTQYTKIETDILSGNFVSLLKRVDELIDALDICKSTKTELDANKATLYKTDKTVSNNNKKKASDPDVIPNPVYINIKATVERLEGDLKENVLDAQKILSQIGLIEFDKDYEFTEYQFTDTTLDDDQYTPGPTTSDPGIVPLGNGQYRKTTVTVYPNGMVETVILVYWDLDGVEGPDEGTRFTETIYYENVPEGSQDEYVNKVLEGTTVSAGDPGASVNPWLNYHDAAAAGYPEVMTEDEYYRHRDTDAPATRDYPTYQDYLAAKQLEYTGSNPGQNGGESGGVGLSGLESAIIVTTECPYDPQIGDTTVSQTGNVRIVEGENGETVGEITLDRTSNQTGETVTLTSTTFNLGDNGNSGHLTYDHYDSHFDCTMSYDETTHTVTETVIDNGRESTRTVPYIAETYEITTASGTYTVTINPNTEAGQLYMSDFVSNLASNQSYGSRQAFDLYNDNILNFGVNGNSYTNENIGMTITLKTQEFYRPTDGSLAVHDFTTGETTTVVPGPGAGSGQDGAGSGQKGRSTTTGTGGGTGGGTFGATGGGAGGGGAAYYTYDAGGNGLSGIFNKY